MQSRTESCLDRRQADRRRERRFVPSEVEDRRLRQASARAKCKASSPPPRPEASDIKEGRSRFAKPVDAARSEGRFRVSTPMALTDAETPDVRLWLATWGRAILDAKKSAGFTPPSRAAPRQRIPITPMTYASFRRKVNDLVRIVSTRRQSCDRPCPSAPRSTSRRRRDRRESPGKPRVRASFKKVGKLAAMHFLTVAEKTQWSGKASRKVVP